jgi:hypothetical protein
MDGVMLGVAEGGTETICDGFSDGALVGSNEATIDGLMDAIFDGLSDGALVGSTE